MNTAMPTPVVPPAPELAGRCEELARAACDQDPTLSLERGWFYDRLTGRQYEHWWTVRADGTIFDPSVGQFAAAALATDADYHPYRGVFNCYGCGTPVHEDSPHRYNDSFGCLDELKHLTGSPLRP